MVVDLLIKNDFGFDGHGAILPTEVIADTSIPFRVSLSHFPLVFDLLAGFSMGEPVTSPSRKNFQFNVTVTMLKLESGGSGTHESRDKFWTRGSMAWHGMAIGKNKITKCDIDVILFSPKIILYNFYKKRVKSPRKLTAIMFHWIKYINFYFYCMKYFFFYYYWMTIPF